MNMMSSRGREWQYRNRTPREARMTYRPLWSPEVGAHNLDSPGVGQYFMPVERSLDIDTPVDLELARDNLVACDEVSR